MRIRTATLIVVTLAIAAVTLDASGWILPRHRLSSERDASRCSGRDRRHLAGTPRSGQAFEWQRVRGRYRRKPASSGQNGVEARAGDILEQPTASPISTTWSRCEVLGRQRDDPADVVNVLNYERGPARRPTPRP